MILVVGATGQLGGLITRTLLDQGKRVRILVRGSSPYDHLVAAGAEPVTGDLKEAGSLPACCSGVESIVTTANSALRGGDDTVESVDLNGNRNLIDAATAAGVRQFVFISALGASPDSPVPFLRAKGEAEQRLHDSGTSWTALQPNAFMDVWFPAVVGGPALAGQPVTLVGEGRRRHSFVAMRDVAAYAVAALDQEAKDQTLSIGGPDPVSWWDVIAAFNQELGRELPVRSVQPGQAVPGLPDSMTQLLAAMETYDSPIDSSELARTYGVTPTSAADFVRGFLTSNRQGSPGAGNGAAP
jgi:NADH dehydrogenase